MEDLLQLIQSGVYSSNNLPPSLYLELQAKFNAAIFKGWGKELSSYSIIDPEYQLLNGFSQNMQKFSGAKTLQQVKDLEAIIGSAEFIKQGKNIMGLYNDVWMQTELDAVIKLADEARNSQRYDVEKNMFPLLQFQTVSDARVRPEHAALDGVIKPVNDPFWNTYSPPLGWNCRCILIQLEDGKVTPDSGIDFTAADKEIPKVFRNNPARSGKMFKETGKYKHPYFNGVTTDQLTTNFGMGLV